MGSDSSTEVQEKIDALKKEWYEFESWAPQFGSPVVAVISSRDESASYEMDRAHVFALENGSYAFVTESGCSCYETGDADIKVVRTKVEAEKLFNDWVGRRL